MLKASRGLILTGIPGRYPKAGRPYRVRLQCSVPVLGCGSLRETNQADRSMLLHGIRTGGRARKMRAINGSGIKAQYRLRPAILAADRGSTTFRLVGPGLGGKTATSHRPKCRSLSSGRISSTSGRRVDSRESYKVVAVQISVAEEYKRTSSPAAQTPVGSRTLYIRQTPTFLTPARRPVLA